MHPTDTAESWRQLLALQDGTISRRQARLGGMSEDAWQWQLDTGRWQAVLPGVAVGHSGQVTQSQRAWAATLAYGPGTYLSGDAALSEQGMRIDWPAVVHVAVGAHRDVVPKRTAGPAIVPPTCVRPHAVRHLARWIHPVRRPPLLCPEPALLHAVAWAVSDRAAEWRIAAAVQQRVTRPQDVRLVLAQLPRLPRRALALAVLDDVELGAHAQSELDFLAFLRRNRLPLPDRLQRPVRAGTLRYLDAWWERQRVAVEVDGAHHRDATTWDVDVLRANDVVLVERHDRVLALRLTTGNLRHEGARVAAQLRTALLQ